MVLPRGNMLRWRRPLVVGGAVDEEVVDDSGGLGSFSVVDVCLKRGGKFCGETDVELPVWFSRDVDDDGDF